MEYRVARLFEVVQKVKAVNVQRRRRGPAGLPGKSCVAAELERDPSLELDYIIAKPQMAHYMEVSTQIYNIYLKYIAPRTSTSIPWTRCSLTPPAT